MCGGGSRGAARRWAGAGTRAERALALAAAALGAALAALAVLLAAHLAACPHARSKSPPTNLTRPLIESGISTRCTAGLPAATESFTETLQKSTGVAGVFAPEPADGEPVDEREYGFVLALVKVEPAGVTFGCVLAALTPRWTLTAASCVQAIEEVDSLESYVMLEGRGGAGVAVEGVRAAGGLALLRAARALRARPAPLARSLDFHRFAIGERLVLLGFGKFRSVETGGARRLRAAGVVRLPAAECAGADGADGAGGVDGADGADGAAPRHLRPVPAARAARCAAAPLCAGVLFGRAQPCQYCAGAALVWRGALAGVWGAAAGAGEGAGAGGGCGGACEPARAPRLAAAVAALLAAAEYDDPL